MGFGENLCKARRLKGLSQEDLANYLNVSRQSVSLWENNQTVPSLDNLMAICEALGISSAILLGQENFPDEKARIEAEITEAEQQRLIEERKKENERLQLEEKNKTIHKKNKIALIFALCSMVLAFIPIMGIIFPILGVFFSLDALKLDKSNRNISSLIISIAYILASICFFVYFIVKGESII